MAVDGEHFVQGQEHHGWKPRDEGEPYHGRLLFSLRRGKSAQMFPKNPKNLIIFGLEVNG